jgi:predicted TIM-barrel fold metal-dependent hydrolase
VRRYSNVYIETSAVNDTKYLEMAVQEVPVEKLLFGTYSPEVDPRVAIYQAKLLKLPAAQEAQFLGGNLRRLLAVAGWSGLRGGEALVGSRDRHVKV